MNARRNFNPKFVKNFPFICNLLHISGIESKLETEFFLEKAVSVMEQYVNAAPPFLSAWQCNSLDFHDGLMYHRNLRLYEF